MGDENPIRTLEDYSKPSHEGYRNTIELPVGNNMVPLRSDTIRLVQNGWSFHGLRSEDPNQHLKDFLKLVDSLDDIQRVENKAKNDNFRVTFDDVFTFIEIETKSLIFLDHTIGKSTKLRVQRPRGTTQVVTRGILMIKCQVAGTRYYSYEVAMDGQLGDDTCPKHVIRGCQACVSPRYACIGSVPIIGNNEAVGGWQKDQNTLRSCNMSGG
ncbi:hypothetical protein Tco_0923156 [Tanacetum coccineum]|uniref:MAK10-like protein n=1 Tax=Tanacetum coccineum TaxID=301880 RepID=A0ABQ5D1R1_9ASTR